MIKYIADKLCKWCEKTGRVFYITGGPAGKTVYLVRYIVFKSKYCCLYIHRFMRSDADDPHDHPWNFFTYVISGGYKEVFYDKNQPTGSKVQFDAFWTKKVNTRLPKSLAYRRATDVHQVVVDRDYDMEEIEQAPYTVCLIGPRIREWGFWLLKDRGATFIDWRKYLSVTPNDPRIQGSE